MPLASLPVKGRLQGCQDLGFIRSLLSAEMNSSQNNEREGKRQVRFWVGLDDTYREVKKKDGMGIDGGGLTGGVGGFRASIFWRISAL